MANSTLANLTAITNLADSDLLYVVQNSTDYKMTNAQLVNFAKSKIVVALTQAQYDNLSPAEKNNGSVYVITDATFDLGDLSDVTITGTPSAGEVLVADGSGGWENGDISDVAYDNTSSGLAATDVQGAIDELGTAQNITITPNSTYVENVTSSVIKLGKVVYYYISFSVKSALSGTGTPLFTGMPAPSSNIQIPATALSGAYSGSTNQMGIMTTGTVQTNYTSASFYPVGAYVLLSGMYII